MSFFIFYFIHNNKTLNNQSMRIIGLTIGKKMRQPICQITIVNSEKKIIKLTTGFYNFHGDSQIIAPINLFQN